MVQVRKNVFETNSSSTHSLVIAEASEFDKWVKGEVYYCESWWSSKPEDKKKFESGKFYPKAEIDAYYESIGEERDSYHFQTYDEFCESEYLEVDEHSYTTPKGEVIRAVCKFGYDG